MAKQLNGDYPLGRMRNCFLKRELYTKRIAIARLDPYPVISNTEYEGNISKASESRATEYPWKKYSCGQGFLTP